MGKRGEHMLLELIKNTAIKMSKTSKNQSEYPYSSVHYYDLNIRPHIPTNVKEFRDKKIKTYL